jgi:hypothetical protein
VVGGKLEHRTPNANGLKHLHLLEKNCVILPNRDRHSTVGTLANRPMVKTHFLANNPARQKYRYTSLPIEAVIYSKCDPEKCVKFTDVFPLQDFYYKPFHNPTVSALK